jgi:hypothetical protein
MQQAYVEGTLAYDVLTSSELERAEGGYGRRLKGNVVRGNRSTDLACQATTTC